jgi:hypothetical protein
MIQNCPSCQSPLDVSAFEPGQQVKCFSCGGTITVEETPAAPLAPPPPQKKGMSGCAIAAIVVAVLMIVIVPIIAIIAAIAIPGLLRARIASNETAAIGTLRTLITSETQWQAEVEVDQDDDGTGEFGFFQELSGTVPVRGGEQPVSPAYVTSVLGSTAQVGDGIASKSGYLFVVYLPDGNEGWISEASPLPPANPAAADAQEQRFVIYAWPASVGNSGNRAFVVTEQGEVFATANRGFQDYNGMMYIPEAEAAFPEGSRGDEQQLIMGETTMDGAVWLPAGN